MLSLSPWPIDTLLNNSQVERVEKLSVWWQNPQMEEGEINCPEDSSHVRAVAWTKWAKTQGP